MTITAFIRNKKENMVYLASDRQVTTNNGIYKNNGKIYKKEIKFNDEYLDIVVGRAGNLIYTQLLENFIDLEPKQEGVDCDNFDEWWLKYIVPQWDEWVENRRLMKNDINNDFAHFLIVFKDKVYHVVDYYEINEIYPDFYCIGEGANHCKGAIKALMDHSTFNSRWILEKSIDVTNGLSAWCSNVSDIWEIPI